MTGYIPKDKRKKILFIGDDIRFPTGVAGVMRNIVLGTAYHYNYVIIGGGINHPEVGHKLDLSTETNKLVGIEDSSVILFPCNGYGSTEMIQQLVKEEQPDVILFITDPRYYQHLFLLEHTLRTKGIKLIYLQIWDEYPSCLYNYAAYSSVDALFAISRQTKLINKIVLNTMDSSIEIVEK